MMRPVYLGAVIPDGFILQLTILLSVGKTGEEIKQEKIGKKMKTQHGDVRTDRKKIKGRRIKFEDMP